MEVFVEEYCKSKIASRKILNSTFAHLEMLFLKSFFSFKNLDSKFLPQITMTKLDSQFPISS